MDYLSGGDETGTLQNGFVKMAATYFRFRSRTAFRARWRRPTVQALSQFDQSLGLSVTKRRANLYTIRDEENTILSPQCASLKLKDSLRSSPRLKGLHCLKDSPRSSSNIEDSLSSPSSLEQILHSYSCLKESLTSSTNLVNSLRSSTNLKNI